MASYRIATQKFSRMIDGKQRKINALKYITLHAYIASF